jgi:hypothetical protein
MEAHYDPYSDIELKQLESEMDDYFLKQFLSILYDPQMLNQGVSTIGVCRINSTGKVNDEAVPVRLTEFALAFDEKGNLKSHDANGNFKEDLLKNYKLIAYKRITDEIDQYGLGNKDLSDMQKLMISGAIMEAGAALEEKFIAVTERYFSGNLSDELEAERKKVNSLKNNTQLKAIQLVGNRDLYELTKQRENLLNGTANLTPAEMKEVIDDLKRAHNFHLKQIEKAQEQQEKQKQSFTEDELNLLKIDMNNYFLDKFLTILYEPPLLDESVKTLGTCRIKDEPVSLIEFKDAFDAQGNFKNPLPEGYDLVEYLSILNEMNRYGLQDIGLSDMQNLMISGAIFQAALFLEDQFERVNKKYSTNILTDELANESSKITTIKSEARSKVIQLIGNDKLIELTKNQQILLPLVTNKQFEQFAPAIKNQLDDAFVEYISKAKNQLAEQEQFNFQINKLITLGKKNPDNKGLVFKELKKFHDANHKTNPNTVLRVLDEALDQTKPLGNFFWKPRGALTKWFGWFPPQESRGTLIAIQQLKDHLVKNMALTQAKTPSTKP